VTPCSCPAGTTYQESATFAVIGAAGTDVRDLVASCASKPSSLSFSHPPLCKVLQQRQRHTTRSPPLFPPLVFKTSWFGALPYATNGIDFQPGATRSYKFPTSIGVYDITEELTYFQSCSSGSFIWKLEQAPNHVQIEYHTHNGSFSGYWATMRSDAVFQNETAIAWSVYENATGHPLSECPERSYVQEEKSIC